MQRYTTDRARPGLVASYDIRPGNGEGQFLQPRSRHGAETVNGQIRRKQSCTVLAYNLTLRSSSCTCTNNKSYDRHALSFVQ